ncbi:MAG: hypothetical protein KKD74_09100 [Bacteroidetes bacterium]|nr:hypothetical protein [Bacteroidales bacterium]MBU1010279.1 hypothetical protein [Bacteroidota bacterium]
MVVFVNGLAKAVESRFTVIFRFWLRKRAVVIEEMNAENFSLVIGNQVTDNHPENGECHNQFDHF